MKRIRVTSKLQPKIRHTGAIEPRVDPALVAKALGAQPVGVDIGNRARAAAQGLNDATDDMNDAIREAEAALAGLRTGVSVEVAVPPDQGTVPIKGVLRFRKLNAVWRLTFVSGGREIPLTNASRGARLAAVAALPALVAQIVPAIERELVAVKAAVERVDAFARDLKDDGTGERVE